jgi:hypothetical protein
MATILPKMPVLPAKLEKLGKEKEDASIETSSSV